MALWEYKVISSGKGGFATPALLESFLNQLGNEDWEIIEFRTLPDNPLAFSGLARRPTQRDWTLEAAAAAAAKVEADKLRAEFAAKFQGANASGAAGDAAAKEGDTGIPNRDETYRRPRDTEHDQDPYALDDSAGEEQEDIPDEDVLPTFFEAVRPHMRRNQKGPGYSVGVDYLLKKFEMIEDDLFNALKEIGFSIPEDEDDRPVYVEYDGDIYWLNTNRRGELWLNTREKPRPVFKVVKANRLSPEEEAQAEQPAEAPVENQGRNQQQRRQDQRQEQRQRRQEQQQQAAAAAEQAQQAAQAAAEGVAEENLVQAAESEEVVAQSAEGEESSEPAQGQPQQRQPRDGSQQHERGEKQPVHLPEGLGLLERLRPLMRRSRGGWSGTISYLSRALRNNEAGLVEALGKIGLVPPAVAGEKAPVVESGAFSYWLNRDGRGGIWINVRESKRMRHEEKQGKPESTEPGAASVETPESSVSAVEASASVQETPVVSEGQTPAVAPVTEAESVSVTEAPVTVEQAKAEEPVALVQDAPSSIEPVEHATPVQVPAVEAQPVQTELSGVLGEQSTLPLAGVRLLLKEGRPGVYSAELCTLAEQLEKNVEEFLSVLVSTGLKAPERPREKAVTVEHANEAFWLSRNTKGELWLNAKAAKLAKKEDDEEDDSEPVSTEEEAAAEKPKRAPRSRRKTGTEETQS